ncbi:MAG: hypothetical protein CBC29_05675 [Methylococcaceae bacterium TMED69]|nr:MAG: hypothetical protein CBC29_05675 [Methylococcaceae bacterium TMED69]|tara:strand:+ start:3097 stop:3645 length:549 start_codon:yes stop_codon:yes gene_type:complete
MLTLGLDVSTSATGYCILDSCGKIIEFGYITLAKIKNLHLKGDHFRKEISKICSNHNISSIFIEECFQRYAPGMSSARTITRLASFNGIVQYICFDEFKIHPSIISVSEARKLCGIKTQTKKKAGKAVKQQVFEWVTNHLGQNWPTKTLKSGPRKGTITIVGEAYDMADAWVIANAGFVKSK